VHLNPTGTVRKIIEAIYRNDGRKIYATLVRMVKDFELAEEMLQEAFAAAVVQWALDGVPANPKAWLISTARFKAIDSIRRRKFFDNAVPSLILAMDKEAEGPDAFDEDRFRDDHLRLIFTCCHPALAPNAHVALTLREVCGLSTEDIADAFLTTAPTIAQRIVRAKSKIRAAGIPYEIPQANQIAERLESVLSVIYFVFNEGYSASSGSSLTRADLSREAIRLGRCLMDLLPEGEVAGLLALMLLTESRREARASSEGDLILLEDQDRRLWKRELIEEGKALVTRALSTEAGPYGIQAAISAVHADTIDDGATDWQQIVALYDLLLSRLDSPVIDLNRAVAIAMRDGPSAGLSRIEKLMQSDDLAKYHLAHAARADMHRRLGQNEEARNFYQLALSFSKQEPERRFLERRLKELS
jgi:RNA polymerase sigma-70 factor (ECF subfamily)